MGTRVTFYEGACEGLAEVILQHLQALERWARDEALASPEEFKVVLPALARVRSKSEPLHISRREDAVDLDLVADLFIGDFCDYGNGRSLLREASPGVFSLHHYATAQPQVASLAGDRAASLWAMILEGRGLGADRDAYPYSSSDGVFRTAYWSKAECRELLFALTRGFGPLVSKARAGAARRSATGPTLAIETTSEALLRAQAKEIGLIISVS